MTNREIKIKSLEQFYNGKWCDIGALAVYTAIVEGGSALSYNFESTAQATEEQLAILLLTLVLSAIAMAIIVFVFGPMEAGKANYTLDGSRGNQKVFVKIFSGFKDYWKNVGAFMLQELYIFLWMLLFIIPGIIKAYAYSMTFFILKDNPEMSASEAIEKSEELMNGNKWKLFCLDLSFIGWHILGILTLGILEILKVIPWQAYSHANFYNDLVGANNKKEVESEVLEG